MRYALPIIIYHVNHKRQNHEFYESWSRWAIWATWAKTTQPNNKKPIQFNWLRWAIGRKLFAQLYLIERRAGLLTNRFGCELTESVGLSYISGEKKGLNGLPIQPLIINFAT